MSRRKKLKWEAQRGRVNGRTPRSVRSGSQASPSPGGRLDDAKIGRRASRCRLQAWRGQAGLGAGQWLDASENALSAAAFSQSFESLKLPRMRSSKPGTFQQQAISVADSAEGLV
jgi:hypothetical protein